MVPWMPRPFAASRLCRAALPQQQQCLALARCFSTTILQASKTVKPHRLPMELIPPYPYGERRVYKQSNRGLYAQARIRFGHNVAEKHNNKTRRFWRPNIHVKVFYLPSLGAKIKTRLTLRVLKTIRKEGGLEEYVLKSKPARIKDLGPGGWNLRWILMQTRTVQERFNEERKALGLEPKPIVNNEDVIEYALDRATPGPLSLRSRRTLLGLQDEAVQRMLQDAFVLGNDEELFDAEGVEELSDEAEARLLKELDEVDIATLKSEHKGKQPVV
ncbi:hypothetical protein B0I35DRAFT_408966 [Stachybotrys elegans]|uniref:Uncharacterized protein n=1 Tax=Stachybotrys elegans TaxID=80388 RepID=A0A8K0WTF9_9HYPO|nr:hypothetical protein B0I35DRAFT_408966 [Stachybotrys elegans]